MSKSTSTRTDGIFGKYYSEEHKAGDLGKIITAYRKKRKCDYRTAWNRWFKWAGKKVKA